MTKRLAEYAGLDYPTRYVELFGRVNLCHGERFSLVEARKRAEQLCDEFSRNEELVGVVLLGRAVERAFGVECRKWFEWYPPTLLLPARSASSPHPSIRNRWWDVEENREAARDFWRATAAMAWR